ncbi:MAG TPA: hypothetical protein VFE23_10740 [Usitatibacter sp.]|jgi:hypothetical protein|nr:hypothetical protein [Usitatibacter sp.]
MYEYSVSGYVSEVPPGKFFARALAIRAWETFLVQKATLTGIAFPDRHQAELQLEQLMKDLRRLLPGVQAGDVQSA